MKYPDFAAEFAKALTKAGAVGYQPKPKTENMKNKNTLALAEEFVRRLNNCLTADEIAKIRRRNATPEYSDACASHDFIDANVVMDDAFTKVVGREMDANNGSDATFWNEAWDIAKREFLTEYLSHKESGLKHYHPKRPIGDTYEYRQGHHDGRQEALEIVGRLIGTLQGIKLALNDAGGFEKTVAVIDKRITEWNEEGE